MEKMNVSIMKMSKMISDFESK